MGGQERHKPWPEPSLQSLRPLRGTGEARERAELEHGRPPRVRLRGLDVPVA